MMSVVLWVVPKSGPRLTGATSSGHGADPCPQVPCPVPGDPCPVSPPGWRVPDGACRVARAEGRVSLAHAIAHRWAAFEMRPGRCHGEMASRSFRVLTQEGPSHDVRRASPIILKLSPAVSYSPTGSPLQYHRR